MGNHRFKLSDMLPNSWFYKLIGITSKRRRQTPPPPSSTSTTNNPPPSSSANCFRFSYHRKSYYLTRDFTPRKSNSSYQTKRKTKTFSSSISAGCSSWRASTLWTNKSSDSASIPPPPDYSVSSSSYSSADGSFRSDRFLPTESFDKMVAWSSCDKIGQSEADADDIIINVDCKPLSRDFDKLDLSDLDLPPIITKTVVQFDDKVENMKIKKQQETAEKLKYRKSSAGNHDNNASLDNSNKRRVTSPRLRLRVNSPRIGLRRIGGGCRGGRKNLSSSPSSSSHRSLADSLAIVKASFDPQKDFRESMVEMIVENNIKASKDLEDLLACYLSLNSDEYHDLIINVFKQIWLDLSETPAN